MIKLFITHKWYIVTTLLVTTAMLSLAIPKWGEIIHYIHYPFVWISLQKWNW